MAKERGHSSRTLTAYTHVRRSSSELCSSKCVPDTFVPGIYSKTPVSNGRGSSFFYAAFFLSTDIRIESVQPIEASQIIYLGKAAAGVNCSEWSLRLCFDELHDSGFGLLFKTGEMVWATPLTTIAIRVFVAVYLDSSGG